MISTIERIYRSMMLAFGRGRITYVDDSGPVQKLQARFGQLEIVDNMPAPHDYGYTSNPPLNSDIFANFLGGNRKNGIVIAIGNQTYRMKNLKSGEVAIYDNIAQSVYLTQAGIVVNGGGLPVTINNTPKVTINASAEVDLNTPILKVTGDIIDNSGTNTHTIAQMRSIYNSHTQSDPQGGSVGTPTPLM
ncbi:phage baseplate assembly protein [soil metagenome]